LVLLAQLEEMLSKPSKSLTSSDDLRPFKLRELARSRRERLERAKPLLSDAFVLGAQMLDVVELNLQSAAVHSTQGLSLKLKGADQSNKAGFLFGE